MSDLKQWVAVDAGVIVHAGFSAPQSYIDDYDKNIVERSDITTPPWYHEGVTFLDVTDMNPKPSTDWFLDASGAWLNGNASLTVNRTTIPADGTTIAVVTFAQKGPKAPAKVKFNVNGQEVEENLANGVATLEITSVNPGDVIEVKARNQTVTITVEG